MAAVIGKVSAVFTASTSGLTSGCNRASAALNNVSRDVSAVRSSMARLTAIQGAQLFGQVASAASSAIRSFLSYSAAQGEVIDKTSKLAARLGMTYGELAGLSLAGNLAGIGIDTIATAATKADVAFVKAANGSKVAVAAFAKIGLSAEKLNGLSAAQRFDAIATAIAGLPTEAERAAAAIGIFGKAGAQLLPLFADGAQGIAAARAEAERFGLALTTTQGKNVESMNDAFTRAGQAIAGIVGQVQAYLAPAIDGIVTKFSNFIGDVGGATIGQAIGEALLSGAMALAQVADYVVVNWGGLFDRAAGIAADWGFVWQLGDRVANLLYSRIESVRGLFLTIVGIFHGVVADIAMAVASIAEAVPFMSGSADKFRAAAEVAGRQSRENLVAGTEAGANSTKALGVALFGRQPNEKPAAPGAAVQFVQSAVDAARLAAQKTDVAVKATLDVKLPPAAAAAGPSTVAVKATDSTSKEGIAEMFRLMRGESETVQEEQLSELRGIREAIENQGGGEDFTEAAIAGM